MTWVLLIILYGGSGVSSVRFPNKPACDQARLWVESKTSDVKTICMQDIEEFPADTRIPESEKNQ